MGEFDHEVHNFCLFHLVDREEFGPVVPNRGLRQGIHCRLT